jgi:drug/metabolite transporter (DMT)-like permease
MPVLDPKLFALAGAICFGLGPILVKFGFARAGRVDGAVMVALAIAIPLYLALLPLVGGLHLDLLTTQAVIGFALGGLFGGGIGRRWMYIAIDRIGASPATAIKNAAPLFTTAAAAVLFQEQVTIVHWLATVAIVAGITLVTWRKGRGFSLLDPGVLAALFSALSYAVRPLVVKFGLEDASIPVTASLIGASTGLVYAVIMARPWRLSAADLPGRGTLRDPALPPFIGSGILQAFGILFITTALSGGDVSVVYPITASAPLFTVAFTWLFLRGLEGVTWRTVAGAAAVVTGVVML